MGNHGSFGLMVKNLSEPFIPQRIWLRQGFHARRSFLYLERNVFGANVLNAI